MTDRAERAAAAERAARAGGAVALERFRTGIDVETKSGKTDVVTQADLDAQARVVEVVRESFPGDAIVGEERVEPRSTDGASGRSPRAEGEPDELPPGATAWVVDPIDGTNNYVRGVQWWATSVAAVADGEAVAAANVLPALGDVYLAGPDGVTLNGDPVSVSDRTDPETFAVAPTIWWDFDRRDEFAAACRAVVERFGDLRRLGCAQAVLSMVAAGQYEAAITNVEVNPWDSVAGVLLVRRAGGVVTDVHGDPWEPGCEGLVASNGAAHDEVLAAARDIDGPDR